MSKKKPHKLLLILVAVASVVIFVTLASQPSLKERYEFWRDYESLDSEHEGVFRYQHSDGSTWSLFLPKSLTHPHHGRTEKNYYFTGSLIQLYSVHMGIPVLVNEKKFTPKFIQSSDWTKGLWIYQDRKAIPAMLSSPKFKLEKEEILKQLKMHGVSFDPIVTMDGTHALKVTHIPQQVEYRTTTFTTTL